MLIQLRYKKFYFQVDIGSTWVEYYDKQDRLRSFSTQNPIRCVEDLQNVVCANITRL